MGRRKFCKEPGAWRLKGEDTKLACSALVKTWGEVEEVWEGVLKRGSKRHEGKIGGGEEDGERGGMEKGRGEGEEGGWGTVSIAYHRKSVRGLNTSQSLFCKQLV